MLTGSGRRGRIALLSLLPFLCIARVASSSPIDEIEMHDKVSHCTITHDSHTGEIWNCNDSPPSPIREASVSGVWDIVSRIRRSPFRWHAVCVALLLAAVYLLSLAHEDSPSRP